MSRRSMPRVMAAMVLAAVFSLVLSMGAQAQTAPSAYTVQKGDSLCRIAREKLGDEKRWKEIYECNRDKIRDPDLIRGGQVLTLPEAAPDSAGDGPEEGLSQSATADEEAQALLLADAMEKKAAAAEPQVTALLQSMESEKASLTGLEHRLKSTESLERKILLNAHDMEVTPAEAAANINDVLRYTYLIGDADYTAGTKQIIDTLLAAGYQLVTFKNYWANETTDYEGINTWFRTPEGVIFELQFHTPVSYDVKDKGHVYYEIMRDEHSTPEEKAEAERKEKELFALIPFPEGVKTIQYERSK